MYYFPVLYPFYAPLSGNAPHQNFLDIAPSIWKMEDEMRQSEEEKLTQVKEEQETPVQKEMTCALSKKRQKKGEYLSQNNESDYEPKCYPVNSEHEIVNYPKKNTESNIINQIFSYMAQDKKIINFLRIIFHDEQKVKSFCQIMKDLKKSKKKYVNRKYLEHLCAMDEQQPGYKMIMRFINKMKVLSVEEFRRAFSTLALNYLKNESTNSILTSRKINRQTTVEHLSRKREICKYLQAKLNKLDHQY